MLDLRFMFLASSAGQVFCAHFIYTSAHGTGIICFLQELLNLNCSRVSQPIFQVIGATSLTILFQRTQERHYRERAGNYLTVYFRVGQTLNVYWEKTPESVIYEAIRKAISCINDVQLIDYTCTEDIFAPELQSSG